MAVVFDAQGSADASGGNVATPKTFANLTVGSGANRAAVFIACMSNHSPGTTTMTWDQGGTNQACSFIGAVNNTGTAGRVELWGLVAPTSGTKTLQYSWTGGTMDIFLDGVAYTGVDQTGGTTSFANFNSAQFTTTATTQITLSITSGTANAVVGAGSDDNVGTASMSQTQIFLDDTTGITANGTGQRAAGAASVSLGWTPVGTGATHWALAGVSIQAVGSGVVTVLLDQPIMPQDALEVVAY